VQVLCNIIDFGMSIQEAGDAPRFHHEGSSEPTGEAMTDGGTLHLEAGFSPEVERELVLKGHRLTAGFGSFGGYQGIWIDAERGVLVCTSGIGMSIIANKYPGIRAALVQDLDGARSSREHNDANILVLGGAKTEKTLAQRILETWLETPFAGGRHQRRVDKISAAERELGTQIRNPSKS